MSTPNLKYEGRLAGLNLLTGRTDAENARILASHLQRPEVPAESKEILLFSTCRKVFGGLYRAHSPTHPLWVALRETSLIETLLQVLIRHEVRDSKLMPREELDWCVSEALTCLSIVIICEPWQHDSGAKFAVKTKAGAVLERIHAEYGLKSKSDPEQLYEIQSLAATAMGLLLSEFEAEESFRGSIEFSQLASLALAVVFDPQADSDVIGSINKDVAHRHARNILAEVNAGPQSSCYERVAPAVVTKYGARRITSKCISHFANPRYISRCYLGLGLCGAMAAAKTLHSKFIYEARVHLIILQWFWKSFRGPQEVHPEDKEVDHANHDLTKQLADVISVLWAITCHLSSDLRRRLIYDLVVEGDLVMAIGHWFFLAQTTDAQTSACKGMTKEIAEHYGKDQQFVSVYIEPTWRHILKSLNSAERSGVQTWSEAARQIWLFFGDTLGLVARNHPDESPARAVPDFVKCNSLVCPLYGEYAFEKLEPGVSGLKCTRCQLGMPENVRTDGISSLPKLRPALATGVLGDIKLFARRNSRPKLADEVFSG
ncbi:hypothetical protein M407DRAFT_23027 [Tulasnella calospora MUT 4182]|uniref:Uncharacterized protein n=1 Tax=Tulasnella calospora MUT 4182 TaxID=1051891 RepID=A0A0C3M1V6_9AGAM|nr:hypothetical protein M407DRAFT_23027 [Tulasnella calospora MUT 4182]